MEREASCRQLIWIQSYHLFICQRCRIGLKPISILKHFRSQHQYGREDCDQIQTFINDSIKAISDSNRLYLPSILPSPIAYLPVLENYLYCQYNPESCHYVCQSERNMRKHCRETHLWSQYQHPGRPSEALKIRSTSSAIWTTTRCQRVYLNGVDSRLIPIRDTQYFSDDKLPPPVWDTVEAQLRAIRQAQAATIESGDGRTTEAWLRRTGWDRYLRGYDRGQLYNLVRLDGLTTNEEIVARAIHRVVITSQYLLANHTSFFVRLQLVQTGGDKPPQQPFQPYLDDTSLDRSVRYWQQIVIFFIRTSGLDTTSNTPAYVLDSEQERILTLLQKANTHSKDKVDDVKTSTSTLSTIEDACLDFCISLLDYKLKADEYESPLICALAILGVEPGKGWKSPQQYPSLLSGVLKVARFLVFRRAYEISPINGDHHETQIELVKEMVERFMYQGTYSPAHWVMALRAYGMKIAFQTTADASVSWDRELVMYNDIQFTLPEFRQAVQRIFTTAEELLYDELLFSIHRENRLPDIPWDKLRDNHSVSAIGWSFLRDPRCQLPVNGDTWLITKVRNSLVLRPRFESKNNPEQFNVKVVHQYLRRLQEFRLYLAVLFHVSAQPARITELLTIRHRNSSQGEHRGIFIENQMVVFVTRYYKGAFYKGDTRIIHRYLPRPVGRLLIHYLWLVLPYVERLEVGTLDTPRLSSFLWPSSTRLAPMDAEIFRKGLPRVFQQHMGQRLNVQAYRHIVISMVREFHLPGGDTWGNSNDDDVDDDADDDAWDLQAAHTSRTADRVYGRRLDQLPGEQDSRKAQFRTISQTWHRFLQLADLDRPFLTQDITISPARRRDGSISLESPPEQLGEKVVSESRQETQWERYRRVNWKAQFQLLYGAESKLRFNQHEILAAIHRGDSPILAVLPTGGGKSLLFSLPASHRFSQVTVVVVPLAALRDDLIQRCRELHIPCSTWNPTQSIPEGRYIHFVTPEVATSTGFLAHLNNLRSIGRLDRIAIDECHTLILEDGSFRKAMTQLWKLSQLTTPMICLTATLPPTRERDLWSSLRLSSTPVSVFRAPTRLPTTQFMVREMSEQDKLTHVKGIVAQSRGEGRVIIYCQNVSETCHVARALNAFVYYAEYENKDEALRSFVNQPNAIIVATNALGMGVHILGIHVVVHYSPPRTLLEYVQECGRGGRGSDRVECILLTTARPSRLSLADVWMQKYIDLSSTHGCRRQILAEYLDGKIVSPPCSSERHELLCDLCNQRLLQAQQRELERIDIGSMSLSVDQEGHNTTFQHHQRQLERARQSVRETNQQKARDATRLVQWLADRANVCLLCLGTHQSDHTPSTCENPTRERYTLSKRRIQKGIRYASYAACFQCGFPQSLCPKWKKTDRGYQKQDRAKCDYPEVLYEAASAFFTSRVDRRMEGISNRLGINTEKASWRDELLRKLGEKIVWCELETSILVREVFYWYIDGISG